MKVSNVKILLYFLFISLFACENDIVLEMTKIKEIWYLDKSPLPQNINILNSIKIDFGNGSFSKKLVKSETSGKIAYIYDQHNNKRFIFSFRIFEIGKLKVINFRDFTELQVGEIGVQNQSDESKVFKSKMEGEWTYSFSGEKMIWDNSKTQLIFTK